MNNAFSNEKYYEAQMHEFQIRINQKGFNRTIVEFGGKGRGDYHASRVLPGYDKDIKAKILKGLAELGTNIMMVLNAQDCLLQPDGRTLQGRIRGDSGLRYHEEVIRELDEANKFGIPISDIALSVMPNELSQRNEDFVNEYKLQLQKRGLQIHEYKKIIGYPNPIIMKDKNPFIGNDFVSKDKDLTLISPGGGSGKFGVAISEVANQINNGMNPNFIKFETFPVFHLEYNHPLNLAFEAATADLNNIVIQTDKGVTYDKDIENHQLLLALYDSFKIKIRPYFLGDTPVQFGVNQIDKGILNHELVKKACKEEVSRRISRYTVEYQNGNERLATLERTRQIYALLS